MPLFRREKPEKTAMTRDEFEGYRSRRLGAPSGGMPAFVRGLTVDVPQRIPQELLDRYSDGRVAASSAASAAYGPGRAHVKGIGDEVWICLYADEQAT